MFERRLYIWQYSRDIYRQIFISGRRSPKSQSRKVKHNFFLLRSGYIVSR